MTPQEEFHELIQQAAEHLRCWREMGLTYIGADAAASDTAQVQMLVESVAGDHTALLSESAAPAQIEQQPSDPESAMPRKSENHATAATNLFGENLSGATVLSGARNQYSAETLDDIRAELGDCHRCKLWHTRTNLVFGEGNQQAELMFVGEAPGADEDATGRPFVGRAGQLLTKMIEAIGMKREEVYIANILKSRPPGNRNPEADEVAACKPFLLRQIAAIKPKLIVTLGNPATQGLLETKVGITKLRGQFQAYPRIPDIKVLPTFHPAFLLRSPDKKREAWEDLKKVRAFLKGEVQSD